VKHATNTKIRVQKASTDTGHSVTEKRVKRNSNTKLETPKDDLNDTLSLIAKSLLPLDVEDEDTVTGRLMAARRHETAADRRARELTVLPLADLSEAFNLSSESVSFIPLIFLVKSLSFLVTHFFYRSDPPKSK
jgi:hypothetical protein